MGLSLLPTIKEKNILAGNPIDTEDNWKTKNPILMKGAIFITSDVDPIKFKLGNGVDTYTLCSNRSNWIFFRGT